jgi:hypothetical protein
VKIVMVQIFGFIEDERCFCNLNFIKKLYIWLTTHEPHGYEVSSTILHNGEFSIPTHNYNLEGYVSSVWLWKLLLIYVWISGGLSFFHWPWVFMILENLICFIVTLEFCIHTINKFLLGSLGVQVIHNFVFNKFFQLCMVCVFCYLLNAICRKGGEYITSTSKQ